MLIKYYIINDTLVLRLYMIPGLPRRPSFITWVVKVKLLFTLWEGRGPGSVSPFSELTWPMVPPIYSFLVVKPCFLWGVGRKSVLVSRVFFPIPSSMAILSLPFIKFSAQEYLTTDLGKWRSPRPLRTRPFPFMLLTVKLGIISHFAPARGWQGSVWGTRFF